MAEQELKYSEQALVMINNMPDFNKEDFEKWFFAGLVAGSNNILMYLMEKIAKKATENIKEKE